MGYLGGDDEADGVLVLVPQGVVLLVLVLVVCCVSICTFVLEKASDLSTLLP
jgi:hypothetical protein